MRKILYIDPDETRWWKILAWWEIRRPFYNVFLLICLALSFSILSILPVNGYTQIQTGPALVLTIYVAVVFYFITANVCYIGGSIFQLITRNLKQRAFINKHVSRLFLYGLMLSFLVSMVPVLIVFVNLILGFLV